MPRSRSQNASASDRKARTGLTVVLKPLLQDRSLGSSRAFLKASQLTLRSKVFSIIFIFTPAARRERLKSAAGVADFKLKLTLAPDGTGGQQGRLVSILLRYAGFCYRPDCTLRKVRLEHRMKGDISAGDHAHLDDPRGSIDFRIAKPAHLFR
jgi:hypothetical protein